LSRLIALRKAGRVLSAGNLSLLVNAISFQITWAVGVLLGSVYALAITGLYMIIHQTMLIKNIREWWLILLIVGVGTSVDSAFAYMGVLDFGGELILIPWWLISIWAMFATTLCHSLKWFRFFPWLSALFAAVAGPFSYFAGARLNAVELDQPVWQSLVVLSIWWACFFPLSLRATRWVHDES